MSRAHGCVCSLIILSLAGSAAAQEPVSPEDQKAIEEALGQAKPPAPPPTGAAAVLQALNPELALILGVAGAWFSTEDHLQTGEHDPERTGFNLQQLEMSLSSTVDPYVRFAANLVFTEEGVDLEEAYGATTALPGNLQLRHGRVLSRFGRINATHPHAWAFADQPFAIGRVFGGEGNLGLGLELSWLTPLPWYVEIVGALSEATAPTFYGDADLEVDSPLDLQATLAIEQFFPLSDDWSLLFGLSYASGPNPSSADARSAVYGLDLYLKYRPIGRASYTEISLQTEWLLRRRHQPGDVLVDWNGYAQLGWRFARRFSAAARWELGTPAAGDALDPDWTEDRHRLAGVLAFQPSEFSRLRLQAGLDLPGWADDPIASLFLTCELSVGAHGAHPF